MFFYSLSRAIPFPPSISRRRETTRGRPKGPNPDPPWRSPAVYLSPPASLTYPPSHSSNVAFPIPVARSASSFALLCEGENKRQRARERGKGRMPE